MRYLDRDRIALLAALACCVSPTRAPALIRRAIVEGERADAEFFRTVPDAASLVVSLRHLAGRQP